MTALGKRMSDLLDTEPGPWLLNKRHKAGISQLNVHPIGWANTGPSFDFKIDNTSSTATTVAPRVNQNQSPKSPEDTCRPDSASLNQFFNQYINVTIPPFHWRAAARANEEIKVTETALQANFHMLTSLKSSIDSQESKLKDWERDLEAFDHLAKRFRDAISEVQAANTAVTEIEALLKSTCEAVNDYESSRQSLTNALTQARDVRRRRILVEKQATALWKYHRGPEIEAEVGNCRSELESFRKLEAKENGIREGLLRQRELLQELHKRLQQANEELRQEVVIMDVD